MAKTARHEVKFLARFGMLFCFINLHTNSYEIYRPGELIGAKPVIDKCYEVTRMDGKVTLSDLEV